MMKWETRLRDSFQHNALWWAVAASIVLGLFIRWSATAIVTTDMEFLNGPWYTAARENGIHGLLDIECNYSPLFMYILCGLGSLLTMYPHDFCKLFAVVMEVLMFPAVCTIVRAASPEDKKLRNTAVAIILLCFHPLSILNASAWGQLDTLYTALSLLSLWLMLRGKAPWAMLCLGLALACKLQAIFLLPLFLILWLTGGRRFSLLWFLLVPGVWILSGVPMVFFGESPLYAIICYFEQADLYVDPVSNYPGLLAMLGDVIGFSREGDGLFTRYALIATLGVLGGMAAALCRRSAKLDDRTLLLLGAWCVLACAILLPRMHERYGFTGEILLLCWAITLGKPRGYAYVLLGIVPILSAYCTYMFKRDAMPLQLGGVINCVLLLALTWELLCATDVLQRPRAAREAIS